LLLDSAQEDAKALNALVGLPSIADAIVGFHALQAIEKAIKAVLSARGIAFRRTHDIAELLDLLTDHRLPAPPHAEELDELNPYAVEARYGLIGPGTLQRSGLAVMVDDVLTWAAGGLALPLS
jgi:HEPN domain-containing protein